MGVKMGEPLFSLREAASLFMPKGFSAKALRTEARRGRLRLTRIAGKDCVSESDIREMIELCRVTPKPHASFSESAQVEKPSGSSSTEDTKRALDAFNKTIQALSPNSALTSRKSTESANSRQKLVHFPSSRSSTS